MHKYTLLQSIIKKSFILQNAALSFVNFKNVTINHNLEKLMTLAKIFYFLEYENIEGDYYEFGLFQGTSIMGAMNAYNKYKIKGSSRRFFGFDSFAGIGVLEKKDIHPTYKKGLFKTNKQKILNRINKHAKKRKIEIEIVEGYVEDTIKGLNSIDHKKSGKCAVCLFDMDMQVPTKIALNYIKNSLIVGSILIFDEYHGYGGSINKGEKNAFNEFKKENPKIKFEEFISYGLDGRSFIVNEIIK